MRTATRTKPPRATRTATRTKPPSPPTTRTTWSLPPPSVPVSTLSPARSQFQEHYTAAGIKFYLNPRTNEVRWSPPRSRRSHGRPSGTDAAPLGNRLAGSVTGGGADTSVSYTSRSEGGLPQGWEMRHTPAGRPYYVNHDQRITQWAPPGPAVGSAAPTAGEQKMPYVDHTTAAAAAASAFIPSSAPPVVQQQQQQPHSVPVFFDGGARGGNGGYGGGGGVVPLPGPVRGSGPGAAGGGSLPGHIEVRTNENGRVYYVNHRTKVTSWVVPPREDW